MNYEIGVRSEGKGYQYRNKEEEEGTEPMRFGVLLRLLFAFFPSFLFDSHLLVGSAFDDTKYAPLR